MRAIACVTRDWKIGSHGRLLFDIPEDKKRFKKLTTTWVGPATPNVHLVPTVVMGRKTYESLPGRKPLPGRRNVILSRSMSDTNPPLGFTVVNKVNDVVMMNILYGQENPNLWIIGGGELYKEFVPWCTDVYITTVIDYAPEADTSFYWNLDTTHLLNFSCETIGETLDNAIRTDPMTGARYVFQVYHNMFHGDAYGNGKSN